MLYYYRVHPITGHDVPGEYRYSSTLSSTSTVAPSEATIAKAIKIKRRLRMGEGADGGKGIIRKFLICDLRICVGLTEL
jgi:hypothetical protein